MLHGVTQTIVVPEGTASVDGGITIFFKPPQPPKENDVSPGLTGIGVEYGMGDHLESTSGTWKVLAVLCDLHVGPAYRGGKDRAQVYSSGPHTSSMGTAERSVDRNRHRSGYGKLRHVTWTRHCVNADRVAVGPDPANPT